MILKMDITYAKELLYSTTNGVVYGYKVMRSLQVLSFAI